MLWRGLNRLTDIAEIFAIFYPAIPNFRSNRGVTHICKRLRKRVEPPPDRIGLWGRSWPSRSLIVARAE